MSPLNFSILEERGRDMNSEIIVASVSKKSNLVKPNDVVLFELLFDFEVSVSENFGNVIDIPFSPLTFFSDESISIL